MNRNMMIGGVIAIIVVIVVVVVFVLGGGDDEEGVTADDLNSAFSDLLTGDATAAKEQACAEDADTLDTIATAMSAVEDASVDCTVDGDTATCELTMGGTTESLELNIVDGKVCGIVPPGAPSGDEGADTDADADAGNDADADAGSDG